MQQAKHAILNLAWGCKPHRWQVASGENLQLERWFSVIMRRPRRVVPASGDYKGVCAPCDVILHGPLCQVVPSLSWGIVYHHFADDWLLLVVPS